MRMKVVAESKGRNESAMVSPYYQTNHSQKGGDGVRYFDVRDRDRCDDDRGRDCVDRCDNVLPASAAYRAPFQAIHS